MRRALSAFMVLMLTVVTFAGCTCMKKETSAEVDSSMTAPTEPAAPVAPEAPAAP